MTESYEHLFSTDSCASATCSTIILGGGGAPGPTCSVSNGSFTLSEVPKGRQLIATFNCGGTKQSCIVMSGDSGVTCNPVADGVLQAFLGAMNKSSLSDTSFRNSNIAQMAHAIQQAALNTSTAASSFQNAVSACQSDADPKTCNLNAIKNSSFAGPFTLMQTMVKGWDASAIFTFVTDVLGYTVEIDDFTFSDFGTRMEQILGTDFMTKARAFINALLDDQAAGTNNYVVKAVCKVTYSKYQSFGTLYYNPRRVANDDGIIAPICTDPNDGTGTFSLNGYSSAEITQINTAVTSSSSNEWINLTDPTDSTHSCNSYNPNDTLFRCVSVPKLIITSKTVEPNRNDPKGTHNNNFVSDQRISMVDVTSTVNNALQSPNPPDPHTGPGNSVCLTMVQHRGPILANSSSCHAWFASLMAPFKKDFLGIMGLYMALKNGTFGSAKLSLNDIYKIFSDDTFLSNRLLFQGENMGAFQTYSVQVSGGRFLPPILKDTGNNVCTLDPDFTTNGINVSATVAYNSYFAPTRSPLGINYEDTFKMFETIPTASGIHDFIFKSAYHLDYNPTGSSTYNAMGSANGAQPNPIFCKMTDASGNAIEVDMATQPDNVQISCAAKTELSGVSVDGSGNITVPANFAYPYTLAQWGFQGDSKGGIFVLVDWKTGVTIQPNRTNQFIYQAHNGNAVCKIGDSNNNKVVKTKLTMGIGNTTTDQYIAAYCMNLSAYTSVSYDYFYYGGNVELPRNDANCNGCTWYGSIVGGYNSNISGSFSTPPVCLWTNSLSTDSSGVTTATGGVTMNGAGVLTSLGGGGEVIVDYCSNASAHSSKTEYLLLTVGAPASGATDASILSQLVRSSSGTPTTGSQPLVYSSTAESWVRVAGDVLSAQFAVTNGAGSRVAPVSAPANLQFISLANRAWQTKFDPYCDSQSGGVCHCLDGDTGTPKSGDHCTLEDSPTDPTISQPAYYASNSAGAAILGKFFTTFGGANLSTITCGAVASTSGIGGSCNSGPGGLGWGNLPSTLSGNNGGINWSMAIRCRYKAAGETTYRHSSMLNNDWSTDQQGCPLDSSTAPGSITSGPVTLINPVPMNNAYAILQPDAAAKLANYFTRDTGQGVPIDANAKVFAFDTALALLTLRGRIPQTGISVTSGSTTLRGTFGVYQTVDSPLKSQDTHTDPVSSVLCYIANNGSQCP